MYYMKGIGFFHLHKRTRGSQALEPYPSPRFWIRLLDKMAIAAGVIGPIMTLPQIWQIYHFQDATGVSALSWGAFAILDIPFILYGFVHKNTLIQVTYVLWLVVNLIVAAGAMMY